MTTKFADNVASATQHIQDAYDTIAELGGAVSDDKNLENLPPAISSLFPPVWVTFDANGGTPIPEKQDVLIGEKATRPADPTKVGQAFLGWYLDGEEPSDTVLPFNFDSAPITTTTSLHAEYKTADHDEWHNVRRFQWSIEWGGLATERLHELY